MFRIKLVKGVLFYFLIILSGLGLSATLTSSSPILAQGNPAYIEQIRSLDTNDVGLLNPAGLAFSFEANHFFVLEAPPTAPPTIITLTPFEEILASRQLTVSGVDPLNLTFDNHTQRLLLLDHLAQELITLQTTADGLLNPDPAALTRYSLTALGLQHPRGLTVNPATGDLFIFDQATAQLIKVRPDAQGSFAGEAAVAEGRVSRLKVGGVEVQEARGLAFNPDNGHLYILSAANRLMYELTEAGQSVGQLDLASFGFVDPQGFVFGWSGDPTDDPATLHLFIADTGLKPPLEQPPTGFRIYLPLVMSGGGPEQPENSNNALARQTVGWIGEFSLTPAAEIIPSVETVQATLLKTKNTSSYSPPSPDPSGIAYLSHLNRLLISDGEVDEMPQYFAGDNLFEVSLGGSLARSYNTIPFSYEPTGVAYNPVNRHLYFSDDINGKWVWEMNQGPDGNYDTSDDIITGFKASTFGSVDPEGIAYDTDQGHLFVVDGVGAEVFDINPGPNGKFEGRNDDIFTHFDVSVAGLNDPEGIEFNSDNGHLYVISAKSKSIAEITRTGGLIRKISISPVPQIAAAGLAYAPASANSAQKSLYIVDRGIDNNQNPNENDGKLFEISFPGLNSTPSTPTATPTPSPTPTATPPPPPGATTLNLRVAASSDDVEERLGAGQVNLTSSDLELTLDGSASQVIGLRFQNVTIPPGATISKAYLEFVADQSTSDPTSLTFFGQAAHNPTTFQGCSSGCFSVTTRPKTSAAVTWNNIPAWTINQTFQSPNLVALVQEVVNRSGWNSGNSLAIIIEGSGKRVAKSYNKSPATAPLLHLEYNTTPIPISGLTPTNNGPTPLGSSTTLLATVSTGSNISYVWNFGDGSPLSAPSPTGGVNHTYPAVGSYTAVVTASNSVSTQTAPTSVTIQDIPPVAAFTSTTPDMLGQTTSFSNTSSGSNLTYLWNFGDGSPASTQANPTHTYANTGSYTVGLTVSNSFGSNTTSAQVVIEATPAPAPPPKGRWTLDETSGQRLDSSPHNNHLSDFNTVASALGQRNGAADFERSNKEYLAITNASQTGLNITADLTLAGWVNIESYNTSDFSIMASKYDLGTQNRAYRFGLASDGHLHFVVSPDGTYNATNHVLTGQTVLPTGTWQHVAAVFEANTQTMRLYVGGVLNGSRAVSFNSMPVSTAPFVLGANMQNATALQFFDGKLDDWYVYNKALTAQEVAELMNSATPITGLSASNNGPTTLGQPTTLTASVSGGTNVSYTWAFGDGSSGSGASTTHTYPTAGTFTATVTAANILGGQIANTVVVVQGQSPVAGFTSTSPDTMGQVTSFSNTSSGSNLSYQWNFGDGSPPSTATNPAHTYAVTGTFTVMLTATNSTSSDPVSETVVIAAPSPEPIAGLTVVNDSPTFLGSSTELMATISSGTQVTYLWDFGDGSPSDSSGPLVSHTYTQVGTFTATVTASNSVNNQVQTTSVTIADGPPVAGFSSTTPDTLGETTNFSNTSSGSNLSYQWNFGDGSPLSTAPNPAHTYAITGTFTVILTATNSTGSDAASGEVLIVASP